MSACYYLTLNVLMAVWIGILKQGEAGILPDFSYWPGVCPPHAPRQTCYPNPCLVHKCPMRPEAICEPNYCGGCKPDFFDETGRKIPLKECFDFSCKPGLPIVSCSGLKKGEVSCDPHPDAIFIGPEGCHSCGIYFKFGRRLLARECKKRYSEISNCEGLRKPCSEDPCKKATCNTNSRTLICIPDYCTCTHKFVNEYDQPIQCGTPIHKPEEVKCPPGSSHNQPTRCKIPDPCSKICRADPEAICIHECGSCKPSYFDRKGNRIPTQKCQ